MIRFEDVTIARGGKTILQDVTFELAAGEKLVLTGPSGSGKSTLLMAVVGAVPLQGGRIQFDGLEVAASTMSRVRRSVAFISQEPVLAAETIREALLLPFTFRANRHLCPREEQIGETLARLRLDVDILPKRCAVVSGGEKQRIAIARALLLQKTVFLADEATSALDEESRRAVLEIFADPAFTLLSVAHDPEWLKICSRRLELVDRRVRE